MPLYEYECDAVRSPLRGDSEVLGSAGRRLPEVRQARSHKLMSSPAIQFKGTGFYITDYARKEASSRRRQSDGGKSGKDAKATSGTSGDDKSRRRRRRESRRERLRATATPRPRRRRQRPSKSRRRAGRRKPNRRRLETSAARRVIERRQVFRERLGEVRPPQREVDHRLQEPELVARVVADAFDLARVDRPRLQQLAQAVGQLNLAGAIARGRRERRKDVGRQDVAADDRQVRRRLVARRLLDQIASPDRRRRRAPADSARSRSTP